ncbi:MAG: hypothetical protein CMH54_02915 [Myxococcales bacterium]|nr:hypothetical protein [Myxococcales bacterium]
MRSRFLQVLGAALLALGLISFSTSTYAADCFMCGKDSSGSCAGADQCQGDRADCRKAGCKITGTRSCSTAGNVKTCKADVFDYDTPQELNISDTFRSLWPTLIR